MNNLHPSNISLFMLTLVTAISLVLSGIVAPSMEIGFFSVSVLTALAVSVYLWRYSDQMRPATMVLVYCLVACSITLAVAALTDLSNLSILGEQKDAESGLLIGGLLSFCIIVILSTRLSRRFPSALVWGALAVSLIIWLSVSIYLSNFDSQYSAFISMATTTGCLIAFIGLNRCRSNLSNSQYLGVLSLVLVSLTISVPDSDDNLTANLLMSVVHVFAGLSLLYTRTSASIVNRVASIMWIYLGATGAVQNIVLKVLGFSETASGIPSAISSLLVVAWVNSHKDEFPRGLYWVSCIVFSYFGIYCMLPEDLSDSMLIASLGAISLFVFSCIWFGSSPCPATYVTWRERIRSSYAIGTITIALLVTGVWFKVSVDMLVDNVSPVRLIAKFRNTPIWPGDKAYVRMVMRDESLWPDAVKPDPPEDVKLEEYIDSIRPVGDRFSYVSNTADVMNSDGGFSEGLGIHWKMNKDHAAILKVNQNSAAGLAGLARGEKVLAINGVKVRDLKKLGDKAWDDLFGGWKPGTVVSLDVVAGSGKSRKVPVAIGYDIQNPPMSRILTTQAGKKVGYLYLDSFTTAQFTNLNSHFREFKRNGLTDLVLDLRYNGGGQLMNAWHLGNLIAGEEHEGNLFLRLEHSPRYEDLNTEVMFTKLPESLNTARVIVLTSKESCSASEAIINGLRPYLPVMTVGSTTCGKPYSMDPVEFGDNTLMPVNSRVLNAQGEGSYLNGIRPDCRVKDDPSQLLGDPREKMLETAIHLLESGECVK